jgi:Undecaprenyl-phosphate glucose phosphotransferase
MDVAKAVLALSGQSSPAVRLRGLNAMSRWHIMMAVEMFDLLIIFAAGTISYAVWVTHPGISYLNYALSVLLVALACFLSFLEGHLYEIDQLLDEARNSKSTILRWTLIFAVLAAAASLARQPLLLSRLWFCSFYVVGGVLLVAQRCVAALLIRRWVRGGNVIKSIVIAGVNDLTDQLVARFEHSQTGIRVAGVFDEALATPPAGQTRGSVRGLPILGGIDELLAFTKLSNPDLVILTLPVSEAGHLKEVIRRLRQQPLNIRIVPGEIAMDQTPSIQLSRRELPGVQLITVANRPISRAGLLVKDIIDRCAATVALTVLAPIFLVIACAIAMTSPGPVFFRQTRVGYNGREFRIYKFRTMHHEFSGSYAPTVKGDARVFQLGRWLRKSSIDELPQLINVLKGDMSLVGPRPHMVAQKVQDQCYFEEVDGYIARHRVKPGITGWAQVNGWRGPAHTLEQIQRRVEHDIYYIENWSIWLDLVILIKTVFFGFFGENAF